MVEEEEGNVNYLHVSDAAAADGAVCADAAVCDLCCICVSHALKNLLNFLCVNAMLQ